jgi:ectoine hydroxylase
VIVEPGSAVVRSLFRLHRTNDLFRELCKDPRIAGIARQILGSKVYIHQSRVNFKPAFSGKEFFWHSDFETWHVEDGMPRMRALSVSINLTENNEFNGPLMVVGGSHQTYIRCVGKTPDDHFKDSLRKQEYGVPCCDALEKLVESGTGIAAPKGAPGSATLFDCNTMHGSVGNLSPYPRTNFFVVFNSVDNSLVEPFGGKPPRPEFLGEREVIPVSELERLVEQEKQHEGIGKPE